MFLSMEDKETIAITFRVPKRWLADLDKWRKKQKVEPSRSEAMRTAVTRMISRGSAAEDK